MSRHHRLTRRISSTSQRRCSAAVLLFLLLLHLVAESSGLQGRRASLPSQAKGVKRGQKGTIYGHNLVSLVTMVTACTMTTPYGHNFWEGRGSHHNFYIRIFNEICIPLLGIRILI